MEISTLALMSGFVVAFSLISRRIESIAISGPMIFVAFGVLIGPEVLDLAGFDIESEAVVLLAELTLAVLLFSDASRIDVPALARDPGIPARLLAIGLPLTVALGAGMTALLLTDLSGWEAALVAAILTPTDAALGQAVVTDKRVPVRIRQSLNVESGLNDGLVVPIVAVFVAMVEEGESGGVGNFLTDAVQQIFIGAAVGVGVAVVAGWLLAKAYERDWVAADYEQLAMLAIGVGAYATATELDGNGFIAAFLAGLTASALMGTESARRSAFSEDLGQILALTMFVIFGATMVGPALGALTFPIALCALATLTVGRSIPVWVATVGSGLAPRSRAFLGWFGPRGLASVLFGLLVVEESDIASSDTLFVIVTWVVVVSVVAHGVSATPGVGWYTRWLARRDDIDTMPEVEEMHEHRVRWHWRR
ncbi:MAG: cation:proton antiporter [Acidimicrobiales bacterium]